MNCTCYRVQTWGEVRNSTILNYNPSVGGIGSVHVWFKATTVGPQGSSVILKKWENLPAKKPNIQNIGYRSLMNPWTEQPYFDRTGQCDLQISPAMHYKGSLIDK